MHVLETGDGVVRPSHRQSSFSSVLTLFGLVVCLCLTGAVHAEAQGTLSVAWDPNPEPDVAGYIVDYGPDSGSYPFSVDVGNQTSTTLTGLTPGAMYYVAVRAYNSSAMESPPSDEVSGVASTPVYSMSVFPLGDGLGTITSTPAGIDCGVDCVENYSWSTVVTLAATPAPDSSFDGWGGAEDCVDGIVTVQADITCTATFTLLPPPSHSLTVSMTGDGTGTVTSSPAGIDCGVDCTEAYPEDTVVTLTAAPAPDSTFDGWSGAADCADGVVTMTAAISCTATFTLTPATTHSLTITPTGQGAGTVTSSPAGIDCGVDCAETYPEGSVVTLTATPADGSTFAGWFGHGDCSDASVTMDADKDCHARFVLEPVDYLLTVTLAGSGSGTVTSNPSGISCGADCTEAFPVDTTIVLTASADTGSTFAGWSGSSDCGDGSVTMQSAQTCTATFETTDPTEVVPRWTTTSVPFYINAANDDVSKKKARGAIRKGASAWKDQSGANIEWTYAGQTTATEVGLDYTNNVLFRSVANGDAVATTYLWLAADGTILDADIVLWDGGNAFFTGSSGCNNGAYLEDVATREFGRALGLDDSDLANDTMYTPHPPCTTDPRTLNGNDVVAVETLYPPVGADPPPAAPSNLTAAPDASSPASALALVWTDNADTEDGYAIERSTDGASYLEIAQTGPGSTGYTDGNLAAGTTYWYRVRAFGSGGYSAYSNTASAQTDDAPPDDDPPPDDPPPDDPPAGNVMVDSVSYMTVGGRDNDRHLLVNVVVTDDAGAPVSGANVTVDLFLDGSLVYSGSMTTDSASTAVFRFNNAASGCYQTSVVNVVAAGLTWDSATPANQFCKP